MSHKKNKIKSFISNNYTHGAQVKNNYTCVNHESTSQPCHLSHHISAMPHMAIPPTTKGRKHTTYDKHATTHATLRQTFLTMPPMTNHVFRPNITLTNLNSHCALATITNYHYSQASRDKPFYLCHTWQTISTITHMKKKKKTLDPCLHDKSLRSCHHQKPFHPCNPWKTIFTHSSMVNYFDHATHDKLLHIFHPWKP